MISTKLKAQYKGGTAVGKFRSGKLKDANALTNLAAEAEAYLCHDEEFIEIYKIIYNVTQEIINENTTYILEEENEIIGFYAVVQEAYLGILEYFYIKPKYMDKGYDRTMWNHMVDICEGLGILEIEIFTSPQSKDFYIKRGAVVIKEATSEVDNRIISKLRYKITRKYEK